jgi:hypothetical protein
LNRGREGEKLREREREREKVKCDKEEQRLIRVGEKNK